MLESSVARTAVARERACIVVVVAGVGVVFEWDFEVVLVGVYILVSVPRFLLDRHRCSLGCSYTTVRGLRSAKSVSRYGVTKS